MRRLIAIVCSDNNKFFRLKYFYDDAGAVIIEERDVKRTRPVTKSISDEFKLAGIYEREINEFFGIKFTGNKDLGKRLLLPDDGSVKCPLRRYD